MHRHQQLNTVLVERNMHPALLHLVLTKAAVCDAPNATGRHSIDPPPIRRGEDTRSGAPSGMMAQPQRGMDAPSAALRPTL